MKRRIGIYLIGFSLGMILVFFMYRDKTDIIVGWTPEKRVLKRIKLTEKVISDSMQCLLDCNNFNEEDWELLYLKGNVNFKNARSKPFPIYTVSIEKENERFGLTFLAKDSLSVLIGFKSAQATKCDCY